MRASFCWHRSGEPAVSRLGTRLAACPTRPADTASQPCLEVAISQTAQGRAINCIGSLSRPPFAATTRTFFNRTGNPNISTDLQSEDLQTGDGKAAVKGA